MKYIKLLPSLFLIVSCNADISENNTKQKKIVSPLVTQHYNITISSDLSNRLNPKIYPKAVSDVEIVKIFSECIYPRILTHKRSMNQLDQFRIGFINQSHVVKYHANTKLTNIDFAAFKTQYERINFLKLKFENAKKKLVGEFERINRNAIANPFGSDIWTYMQQGVDDFIVSKTTSSSQIGNKKFVNKYRNVLILLTDGYIETSFDSKKYGVSAKTISNFRKQYLKSGENDIEHFYKKNPIYKIHPLTNARLKELEVLVLELYDRTQTNSGASVHPTDMEIMKLIWTDWLSSSGVKRVELYSKFSNTSEAEMVVMKFLGV